MSCCVTVNIYLPSTIENVALGKMATQIGSFYPYSTADKAVDGNKNQRMRSESCAHPSKSHIIWCTKLLLVAYEGMS